MIYKLLNCFETDFELVELERVFISFRQGATKLYLYPK